MHLILVMSDGSEIDAGLVGTSGGNQGGNTPSNPGVTTYTVTFKDWDGDILKTQTVNAGSAATAPADPIRSGYVFAGWDKSFSNVTTDLVVTATYNKDNSATLAVSSETAEAGDTKVELMVSLENNPGIIGLTVRLEYDDTVLTATRAGTEEAFDELSYQKPANFKNGCKLIFYAAEVEEVMDGDAFYIRFDVAEDAAPGTYPVKLVIEQALDTDSNDVAVVVMSGSIIVE